MALQRGITYTHHQLCVGVVRCICGSYAVVSGLPQPGLMSLIYTARTLMSLAHPVHSSVSYACRCGLLLLHTDMSYVGCFREPVIGPNRTSRPLKFLTDGTTNMTVELCKQLARNNGFVYAGLQFYSTCYGGNDTSSYTTLGLCDTPCAGNNSQMCGGTWTNAIYLTSKPPVRTRIRTFAPLATTLTSPTSTTMDGWIVPLEPRTGSDPGSV